MKITQPRELTRENVEKWGENFVKNVKRTTTRTELDRLILAVERRQFKDNRMGEWTDVVFDAGKGKVTADTMFGILSEDWNISTFEKKILDANPGGLLRRIERTELKEENGEWQLGSMKILSSGGEAVVLEETIGGLEVAVRIQCFDPLLFTKGIAGYDFEWHLSEGEFLITEKK